MCQPCRVGTRLLASFRAARRSALRSFLELSGGGLCLLLLPWLCLVEVDTDTVLICS